MKAIILRSPRHLELTDIPLPRLTEEQQPVLVLRFFEGL